MARDGYRILISTAAVPTDISISWFVTGFLSFRAYPSHLVCSDPIVCQRVRAQFRARCSHFVPFMLISLESLPRAEPTQMPLSESRPSRHRSAPESDKGPYGKFVPGG